MANYSNVITVNLAELAEASTVHKQWKKLVAIRAAAQRADLVIWHDADALPHPRGEIVRRFRRLAALQPDVDLWLDAGLEMKLSRTFDQKAYFEGVPLAEYMRLGLMKNGESLSTSTMLMRGGDRANIVTGVLEIYERARRAGIQISDKPAMNSFLKQHEKIPSSFVWAAEQGPLLWRLHETHRQKRVRVINWLERTWTFPTYVRTQLGKSEAFLRPTYWPSFIHLGACNTESGAPKCANRFCPLANESAHAWFAKYERIYEDEFGPLVLRHEWEARARATLTPWE